MVIESITVSGTAGGDWVDVVGRLCQTLFDHATEQRNRVGDDGGPLPPLMSESEFGRWNGAVGALADYLLELGLTAPSGRLLSVEIKDAGTNDGGGLNLTARFLS